MKILIIDNHPIVTHSLKQLLEEHYLHAEIEIAHCSRDANKILDSLSFDLVISDFFIDENNGLDIYILNKNKNCFSSFLLVTVLQNIPIIQSAINQGINGIVSKESSFEDYLTAVASAIKGEFYLCENMKRIIANYELNKQKGLFITKRESEIINYILTGLKNKEMATRLNVSVSTIETHKKNLIKKFNLSGSSQLTKFIAENQILGKMEY
jgi:DNA-binding NarL/FixJ family response regulator